MMVRISGILAWNYPIKDIIGPIILEPEAHTCEDIRRGTLWKFSEMPPANCVYL